MADFDATRHIMEGFRMKSAVEALHEDMAADMKRRATINRPAPEPVKDRQFVGYLCRHDYPQARVWFDYRPSRLARWVALWLLGLMWVEH